MSFCNTSKSLFACAMLAALLLAPGMAAAHEANPTSQSWRITNDTFIGDHWNIGELEMYSDAACSQRESDIRQVLYSYWYDHSPQEVVHDGVCNTQGHANPSTWAGLDQRVGQMPRGSWLGFAFGEPTTIRCVRICQGRDATQWVPSATLQYYDGRDWRSVGQLTFSAGESTSIVAPY